MSAYKTPSTLPSAYQVLPSEEEQQRILAECKTVDEENAKQWEDLVTRFKALKAEVSEFMNYNSVRFDTRNPIRVWMTKGPLEHGLHYHRRPWVGAMQDTFYNLKRKAEQDGKRKADEERKQQESLKPARAILFLMKHGQVGDSGTVDPAQAVYLANEYAKRTMIAERMAEGGPFDFSGDDNCEGCDGWDGESRRCNCGNRRVDWVMDGDFEDFDAGRASVYGEAY